MFKDMAPRKKGIIYLLISAFAFAVMALFINLAGDMPVFMKAFFRNVVACIITIPMLIKSPEKFHMKKGSFKYLFLRAAFGTVGIVCNFYAISEINIADALILNKLSPFFAIIASIFVLKEIANGHQWLAICTALVGAIFVIKPTFLLGGMTSEGVFPGIIGFIGGASAGIAYTFLRKLSLNGERKALIVAFFSAFSCIACIPFIIANFQPITIPQLLCCIGAGIAACTGQFTITAAYAACPAKEISIYDYSTVIFAAILGMLFLGEMPDYLSIIGYVIIIGSSVYAFLYNNGYLTKKSNAADS